MSVNKGMVHRIADRLLNEGRRPDAEAVAAELGLSPSDEAVAKALQDWWRSLAGRVQVLEPAAEAAPDSFSRALKLLWQDAVREATRQVNNERLSLDESLASLRQESQSALSGTRADYETLEHRYELEVARSEEAEGRIKLLEAEITVLKANLSGEVVQRKQFEEKLAAYKEEARRHEKLAEDARKNCDQRLREEQAHGQEQLAKVEAELAHLRRSLDQARDEAGKKEAALNRNQNDLHTELVRRDVKLETQQGQLKSYETELKSLRAEHASQRREIAKLNSALLSESNRGKRNDELITKLQQDLRQEQQKLSQLNTELNRKTADWRGQIKQRDEELMRARAALTSTQKKAAAQEEVLRRLTQQRN